jgi:predicted nucleic acid-binding protein
MAAAQPGDWDCRAHYLLCVPRIENVIAGDLLLDTSAILSFIEDEAGADFVEGKLEQASSGKCSIAASFVSITEILYTTIQVSGKRRADELVAIIKSWPIRFVYADEALCLAAGEIKAAFAVSLADAFVAATAQSLSALLIHKDREFESMGDAIKMKALPYRAQRPRTRPRRQSSA